MNAANLWFLLPGNNTDMHLPLVQGATWASPHKLGLGLFLLVSVLCMARAWVGCRRFGEVIGLSMVMLLGFFAVAPSMHERYLFLLVPFAALGCARYFHSYYGLNRSGERGRVRFRILLDGHPAWQSGVVGWQMPGEVVLPVFDAQTLTLQVHGIGDISSDHANWAEAGFWQGIPERDAMAMAHR